MMTSPLSYLAIDPGRRMGFATCLAGGGNLSYGTWKFTDADHGSAYAAFAKQIGAMLADLPDAQVGMEMLTIVPHEGENGKSHVDAEQVGFSAGWPAIAKVKCFVARVRPPEMIAISAWRSKTHGKTRAPNGVKESSKWLKQQAFIYCRANGWSPDTDNAAEALCMLDYLRILHEPAFAFDQGQSFQQERLFA